MNIALESIKLQNFKGIQDLDVDFGARTDIFGQNATGKTTIFDAFLWCLFGKDSLNSAEFDIKPLSSRGEAAHNIEHSVETILRVDSRPMVFKRVYAEIYTKKRGKAAKEFTGHTTEYFIDDVPMKEKEYQERIKGIMDERTFRLLTDPRHFNEVLAWKDRREILMSICGDVSAADVIASDSSLAGLRDVLSNYGIDDYKKMIASKRKEINDALEKIPVRIDEVKKGITEDLADTDIIPRQIEDLQKKKETLESQLADLKNGSAISQKRIELQNIEGEVLRLKNSHTEDVQALVRPLQSDFLSLSDKAVEHANMIRKLEREALDNANEIKTLDARLEVLRGEWVKINAQEIKDQIAPDACPNCGYLLNEVQITDAREKANHQKAEALAANQKEGREKAKLRDALKESIDITMGSIQDYKQEKAHLDEQIADLRKKIDDIRAQAPDLSGYETRRAAVQAEIDNINATEQQNINAVKQQIAPVAFAIDELLGKQARAENNKRFIQRIKDLEKEERELADQFEGIEQSLFLVENFIRAKVGLLEERINEKFSLARFKMFADQINGGLTEVCETTLNGVPYPSINNAGRIQVGMDIIRTLQKHYGITGPVFIDNAESVVELPEMDCQLIRLIVSGEDKVLRIESSDKRTSEKAA